MDWTEKDEELLRQMQAHLTPDRYAAMAHYSAMQHEAPEYGDGLNQRHMDMPPVLLSWGEYERLRNTAQKWIDQARDSDREMHNWRRVAIAAFCVLVAWAGAFAIWGSR